VGDGFVIKSGVCVEGVTPEMLHSFCEDFLISGTCYLHLRKLVERSVTMTTFSWGGVVSLCRLKQCFSLHMGLPCQTGQGDDPD